MPECVEHNLPLPPARERPVLPIPVAIRLIPGWVERDLARPGTREEAGRDLDLALRALARARAEVDLRLGAGLALFQDRFSTLSVCQRTLGDLVTNHLGFSAGFASELMSVARGAERCPVLGEALRSGLLSRSQVREILRVARPETAAGWAR